LQQVLEHISGIVWGPWMLCLLVGTHVFLTIRLRGIQRYIPKAIAISLQRSREGKGEISQYGALVTALAATIGTGNIVGVSTAVAAGGPGAVLWMWLTGVFGIATKYSEALLSVKYRVLEPDGRASGGPMYVLDRALGMKWLAVVFAVFTAVAAFGIGDMVQANSISQMLVQHGVNPWITGSVMTAIVAVVILGGIKSIASVCELLVPFMAIFYVIGCVVLLIAFYHRLPETISVIFKGAFSGQAAIGGFAGAGMKEALRYGLARGLFSNESGLGSAPIVAAAAQTKNPIRQALVSSTGTFWDTVVICLLTGLVVVNSGMWQKGLDGAHLTTAAFSGGFHVPVFGGLGPAILAIGLLTFVFSTILGWSYYGEKACEYLFGPRSIFPYRLLWIAAVMVGSVAKLGSVWAFSDIANALMALPNLISLLLLSGVIVAETRKYLWDHDGVDDAADDYVAVAEMPERGFPVEQSASSEK
jgi:alanine or glycine:cation symporter, AGCS family